MKLSQIRQADDVQGEYQSYLTDEAGIVKQGYADKIFFPSSIDELRHIIEFAYDNNRPITISGAGTGISGGRVPLQGWIIATDDLRSISGEAISWSDPETNIEYEYRLKELNDSSAEITVPISMTVKAIQNLCRKINWFYPPDPTERTAFIGGNVATNASGARSFKFGVTRDWVRRIQVILPNGEVIELDRNGDDHEIDEDGIIIKSEHNHWKIPRPTYALPATDKNVAGPIITDRSQPIDLFIGTGGMFGIISEVTLKLRKVSKSMISMFIFTETKEKALNVIQMAQAQRDANEEPIPMSVEYLGPRAVTIMREDDNAIPSTAHSLIILELEASSDNKMMDYLEFWWNKIEDLDILDTSVAQTHHEIEHHKHLRHLVPEKVNAMVKSFGQAKLGTDFAVPDEKFPTLFDLAFNIGEQFEEYQRSKQPLDGFGYAFWAHAGDSHIHLNLLPRDEDEDTYAKKLITNMLMEVVEMSGSIAAEHGLGKKQFQGKPALLYQYGEDGMKQIQAMKSAIDNKHILNPGNLINNVN